MFKRIFSAMLCAVLALSLTACGGDSSSPAQNSGDSSAAVQNGVLRVGMECAYAPYNWAQSDDSNGAVPIQDSSEYAYGYDVMMAKLLAEKLGCELEIYRIDWDSLPIALQAGKIDCVIAGQSITAERLQTVDFTAPYYYASIVGLVRGDSQYAGAQGVADLKGATATSQINTVWYDTCLPQIENANILPAMETVPTMLVALDSGRADLIVTDQPTALAACAAYSNFSLLDFTGGEDNFQVSEEEINIGISVKKGNTALAEALNAGLEGLTTDDFERMMNEAIAAQPLSA